VRALIAFFIDDLRGLAGPSGGFYAPALRGTCLQCLEDALQVKAIDVTVWPAACKHTPADSLQRANFKKWYLKSPHIKAVVAEGQVAARGMTNAFATRSALKCMRECEAAGTNDAARKQLMQQSYWKEIDVWSELLGYWDRVVQNINDPAHELYNMVKSLISMVGDVGAHKLSAKRRAFSRGLGQTIKGVKPPWNNTKKNQVFKPQTQFAFSIQKLNLRLRFQLCSCK
jgi:hypothetical protein